jgi:hypothetical protein
MSEERGAELFRALHAIIDAVTNLNLRDLKAEAKALSSSAEEGTSAKASAEASAKGKAKDPDPNWTEVPYNPVSITPLSTRPRFSQVVGSSSKSPIVPPSRVALEATSLADYPAYSPAVVAAWAAMNPQVGGQNQEDGQRGPQDGNGDGNGGGGNGLGRTGKESLHSLIRMLLSFLPRGTPLHQTRIRIILSRRQLIGPVEDVQLAAMLKINLRMQALVV